jgi:hypothetical protein
MSHVLHDLSDYGVIGIVTFVVNQSGKVHEQDLGDDTALKAAASSISIWIRIGNR